MFLNLFVQPEKVFMHPAADKTADFACFSDKVDVLNLILPAVVLPMPPDAQYASTSGANLRLCGCMKTTTLYAVFCSNVCMYEVKPSMHWTSRLSRVESSRQKEQLGLTFVRSKLAVNRAVASLPRRSKSSIKITSLALTCSI